MWRGQIELFASGLLFGIASLASLLPLSEAQQSICVPSFKQGTCYCPLSDDSGVIDLGPLVILTASQPLPYAGNPYSYYLALCNVIKVGGLSACSNTAASCEFSDSNNYDLGDPETTRFEQRTGGGVTIPMPALVMDAAYGAQNNRRTIVFLKCVPGLSPVQYTSQGNVGGAKDPDGFYLYFMQLAGDDVCAKAPVTPVPPSGGDGSLSGGSILLIIFFVSLFVYFAGGFLLMTYYFKKDGRERIPNVNFWVELPSYAKDGVLFTWHSIKHLTGRYQAT